MRVGKNAAQKFLIPYGASKKISVFDFETRLDFVQCAFVARKIKLDVARVHRLSV